MTYAPTGLALQIFQQRYAIHSDETWAEACARVAAHVAMAEPSDSGLRGRFTELLTSNRFMPGGRIWYGSGRAKGQLLNCFVVPTADSREGWGKTLYDMIVVSGTGGGVGINCSPVRPRGAAIAGVAGAASGAVSLMQLINAAGEVVKSGGGRRTALMLCLGVGHGDIVEFLDAKLDLQQLNNANVSVVFDGDPEDFFELVRNGDAKACAIWNRIVANSLKGGEPGLLNGYLANRMNNIWYKAPLISTNPCGEIWMPAYDCCCLGALVLPRFVERGRVDWSALAQTVALGVRFLDNVLSVNKYPLPEIEATCSDYRRIGLGVMGLHDMLLELGLQYNSPEGLEFVDKLMHRIKACAYRASIELAREKGSFPAFDSELFSKGRFIRTLPATLRDDIRANGLRNCALLTIAPTGTTSMVCGVTSGIEPMFAPAYERRWWVGDNRHSEVVVHPLLKQYVEEGRDTDHFQGTFDLSIRDHLEMQRTCQRHVDNAVSKTINLAPGTSSEELSELVMEYLPELKGITVYPEGSRENQPLTPLSMDEAMRHIQESTTGSAGVDACRAGVCDV
jgi:ribonucleoside-diphosphate reductase alpha chain